MLPPKFKTAALLTSLILLLLVVVTIGGLLLPHLYTDAPSIKKAWYGNDLVTLLVIVPLLFLSLLAALEGSERAQLLWVGALGYTVYNYAFYLFGAAMNAFFLFYVALFSLSIYALALVWSAINVRSINKHFSQHTPLKRIALFLLLVALPLAFFELSQYTRFLVTGTVPEAPSLIFALDLSIVVPTTALAAVLLWRHHPWGYILGAIMLVKSFAYGLVLCLAAAFVADFGASGAWDPLMPFYLFITIGGMAGTIALLRHLHTQPS